MTKIPHDDILEGLYKLRIRESEKLKTVLELYDLETHQKKLGPDYHRLKTMVKRSIEQKIRNNKNLVSSSRLWSPLPPWKSGASVSNCVKSVPPTTENWLRKLYIYSLNNNASNEDKHDTNYINNKYTNTYTRKLHNL